MKESVFLAKLGNLFSIAALDPRGKDWWSESLASEITITLQGEVTKRTLVVVAAHDPRGQEGSMKVSAYLCENFR